MPIERVPAELRGEDGKVYRIQLDVTPGKKITVDAPFAFRIADTVKLSGNSGSDVPDGKYERRFMYEGRPYEHKVQMRGGRMTEGW